jgi:excisionase family DNA binding protein
MSKTAEREILERLARVEKLLLEREGRTIPDRPMSPAEVARIVGKSTKTILRRITSGKLRAKRDGDSWLVRPVDLQRYLEPEAAR